jgi:DNA-binding NtrC family response regulator
MQTPTILIIDDEQFVAQATQMVLKHAGMKVVVATTAAEAQATWSTRKAEIDLLVTDFELDGSINGEELARDFSADRPALKSIVLTAYPFDARFRGRTEGVDFFQKPWDCQAVVRAIKHLTAPATAAPVK